MCEEAHLQNLEKSESFKEQGTSSSCCSKTRLSFFKYDPNEFEKVIWVEWFCSTNKKKISTSEKQVSLEISDQM